MFYTASLFPESKQAMITAAMKNETVEFITLEFACY